jgi:hypothetical protein
LPEPEDQPDAGDDPGPVATSDDTAGEDPGLVATTDDDAAAADPEPSVAARIGIGPIVLAAVAILLLGFIVGRTTSDDDGTAEEAEPLPTAPPLTFPRGDQDRTGYWGLGGVTPVIEDGFGREDTDEGLGTTETGEEWRSVNGEWRISDEEAAVAAGAGDRPAIAVVRGGNSNRLTEATAVTVEAGAGIVFRYQDPDNFWSLTAAPDDGMWVATRVVDGAPTVVAEIPAATTDGTTVTVAQRGAELQVLIEGVEAIRVTDSALISQRSSGLIAPAGGEAARFDRFYVGDMPLPRG